MTLADYVKQAKEELDAMVVKFTEENSKNPDMWPLEMSAEEWFDQELAWRFEA